MSTVIHLQENEQMMWTDHSRKGSKVVSVEISAILIIQEKY